MKQLHDNEYLFDTEDVPEFPAEIINQRLELLTENLARLLDHSYNIRDVKRMNAVLKAIDWHEGINEVGKT